MVSREEENWFHKFYEGTFWVKGWKHRMAELLQNIPAEREKEFRATLAHLGEKIGREWAKDNAIRKIDTDMLKKWGNELSGAKGKGAEKLLEKMKEIQKEVDSLLA